MVTKDEIRELMKDKFVEITEKEFIKEDGIGELEIYYDINSVLYFKPKPQKPKEPTYPIVEECKNHKFIETDKTLSIIDRRDRQCLVFWKNRSFPLLAKIVKRMDKRFE